MNVNENMSTKNIDKALGIISRVLEHVDGICGKDDTDHSLLEAVSDDIKEIENILRDNQEKPASQASKSCSCVAGCVPCGRGADTGGNMYIAHRHVTRHENCPIHGK